MLLSFGHDVNGGDFVAYQSSFFYAIANNPDYKELKARLGSLPGINSMSVDPRTQGVLVVYDSGYLPFEQLQQGMIEFGYHSEKIVE